MKEHATANLEELRTIAKNAILSLTEEEVEKVLAILESEKKAAKYDRGERSVLSV